MRIRWRGFELPTRVMVAEEDYADNHARFLIEPFERGFGTTIGNSLRRVLLSSLEGAAVTSVKFDGVQHEFSTMDGVLEDVADIVLNLKQLRIRVQADEGATLRIEATKLGQVTGADVQAPANVEVVSKDLLIATLTRKTKLVAEMEVRKGRGYHTAEENENEEQEIGRIPMDSIFSPVIRVNYRTEDTRVGKLTNYDRLIMDIWTDGTLTPEMALVEAAKILRKHLNPFVHLDELGKELLEEEGVGAQAGARGLSDLMAKPISELELSVRSSNCLQGEKINTVGDLVNMSEADLLGLRNFGKTSLEEVTAKLVDLGLTLSRTEEEDTEAAADEPQE